MIFNIYYTSNIYYRKYRLDVYVYCWALITVKS